jgi:hypothetical protein
MTLNNFKSLLKTWFQNHAQINSVYYCDDFDFNAERSIDYPTVNIEYLNSAINDKEMNHIFKIVIADITKPDDTEMEDNIISDSLQIAEDFFTYLQNAEGFRFNKTSSLQKFVDDTADRAAGIVFTITLSVIRPQNWCNTPTK